MMSEHSAKPWWAALGQSVSSATSPVLQIAADGYWETAAAVTLAEGRVRALEAVEQVARSAQHDIAVEIMWPANAIFGVRWTVDRRDEAALRTGHAYDALAAGHTAEAALFALLGGAPQARVEFAELGAVNAWRSVGPVTLWRQGEELSRETIDTALRRRPDIEICENPLAVELAVTSPRPCWVGVYVSVPHRQVHRLDRQALNAVLDSAMPGDKHSP
ncbi:hypothetical protein QFZ82_007742 [Streptomyces sp. V4I23]|nr:hypothetical protein [Streptomyces sp. V4I23]